MKRFQKILLILLAVFTVLPCAGMLVQKHALPIRADFGDFGGGDDYGGGGGGGGDWGGGWDDDDDDRSSSHSSEPLTSEDAKWAGLTFVFTCAIFILENIVAVIRRKRKHEVNSDSGKSNIFSIFFLLGIRLGFALLMALLISSLITREWVGVIFVLFFFGIIGVIVLLFYLLIRFADKGISKQAPHKAVPLDPEALRLTVPDYSPEQMQAWAANVYTALQNAWQAKDLSPVRKYLAAPAYRQFDMQLEQYRVKGETNIVSDITVEDVVPVAVQQTNGFDILTLRISTRIHDYVIRDRDGALLRGNQTDWKYMTYEWTLIRSNEPMQGAVSCPCCGSAIEDINQYALCPGCGNAIINDRFDWVITNIKGISQRTSKT
ncbi:MAG: Tim44 domain-containing protein [Oscillospiraceae bacterium]|nr:Tim44 domain-containing protein [Oscillospiraceae bacterium]